MRTNEILPTPDGHYCCVFLVPYHTRRPRSLAPYKHPTGWIAQAGRYIAVGATKKAARANLKNLLGLDEPEPVKPIKPPHLRLVG